MVILDDLTFLHGAHTPRCIASVDKRFDYHTLQFMSRGAVELFYDQRRYELHGLSMWSCVPGPQVRFHEWPRNHPWEHRYIAFTGPRVAVWEAYGMWPRQPEPVARSQAAILAALFDELIELALRPGHWPHLRAVNMLERLLLERAEAARVAAPHEPPWLETVLSQLASSGGERDYQQLARSVSMSLTTLRRRFRAETGQSLHQYRLECCVADARRLLGESDEPIKEIAGRLGYQDVFYFTRQFTQFSGTSPAAYRRSRQR